MKWIVFVYLVMFSGTSQTEKITKLEYHTKTFTECIEIESQINNISKYGHSSDIAYVRSLYWVHSNMLNKISAECVHLGIAEQVPDFYYQRHGK